MYTGILIQRSLLKLTTYFFNNTDNITETIGFWNAVRSTLFAIQNL